MNLRLHQSHQPTQKTKQAWDLFLRWIDQADDVVLTADKKRECVALLDEGPVLLPFPVMRDHCPPSPQAVAFPRCG